MEYVSLFDFIIVPLFLIVIITMANRTMNKHIKDKPYYKYYRTGLIIKLLGGLAFCYIYLFYYAVGADTINYFNSNVSMLSLMVKNPSGFFDILFNGNNNYEQYSWFDNDTGWPYYWKDKNSFFLIRITCFLVLLGFKSYLGTTILIAWISYFGIWKLYTVFCDEFPKMSDTLAIAFFMIPSVAFWGSGLMKDTVTYSACCWFTYSFYTGIINRKNFFKNIVIIFISGYLIMAIKPYILYSLLPGSAIWLVFAFTAEVKSKIVRVLVFPVFLLIFLSGTYMLFQQIGSNLGKWSMNEVLERAVITQNDLVKDYYGGNTFDIGQFDATVPSIASKAPAAIGAGLFRPFIWEARNIVMIISGLENLVFMFITIFLLYKLRIYGIFTLIWQNPLLLYSLVFALFFAFMVGLTTPNFGSLVRYRIPAIPYYLSGLIILNFVRTKKALKNIEVVQEH